MPSFERPGYYARGDEEMPPEYEIEPAKANFETPEPEHVEPGGFEREFILDSSIESLNEAEAKVKESMDALGWSEDDVFRFTLAVREAMANVAIHSNLGMNHGKRSTGEEFDAYHDEVKEAMNTEGKDKPIHLAIQAAMKEISVDIKGGGDYLMDLEERIDPTTHERIMLPHGRGQFFMFNGCDEVRAYPGGVTLVKYRGGLKPSSPSPEISEASA